MATHRNRQSIGAATGRKSRNGMAAALAICIFCALGIADGVRANPIVHTYAVDSAAALNTIHTVQNLTQTTHPGLHPTSTTLRLVGTITDRVTVTSAAINDTLPWTGFAGLNRRVRIGQWEYGGGALTIPPQPWPAFSPSHAFCTGMPGVSPAVCTETVETARNYDLSVSVPFPADLFAASPAPFLPAFPETFDVALWMDEALVSAFGMNGLVSFEIETEYDLVLQVSHAFIAEPASLAIFGAAVFTLAGWRRSGNRRHGG